MPHSYVGKKGHVSMLEISLALLNHMRRTEALYVSDRASMPRKISRLHCLGAKQSSFARGGTWKDVAEEGADMADGGNQMETRATTTFSPHLITWELVFLIQSSSDPRTGASYLVVFFVNSHNKGCE